MTPLRKTILIKAMGNSQIGMGHIYRSISLAKELEKEFQVLFHTNNIPQVRALVHEQDVGYFVHKCLANVIEAEKVNLLLFDQPGDDDDELFETLKTRFPCLKIIALDYFNYDNELVDVIINLFNHNQQKSRSDRDNMEYYEGLEYAIIREQFQNYISQTKEISQRVSSVLVTFGGADPKGNTNRALQLLDVAGFSDVKIEVILGPLWKGKLPKTPVPNIHFHHSVPPSFMVNFMTEADFAFCGAGTTMLELLSLGVPTVVLPQNHWEERFALAMEQRGVVKIIKGDAEQEDISCICDLFTSLRERESLSERGKSLVDGKGVQRIKRIVGHLL